MAALYVLSEILDQVTLMAAPILPHLMEEIEIHHPWHSGTTTDIFVQVYSIHSFNH